jgi:hypothetical protein
MRVFKKRFQKKATAIFLLLIMVESIVQPTISYAIAYGSIAPHQPEYTSYEQPGSTDMVNLLTGDFTFSLPVLEVPGPEGNFSLPLTYNAGIGHQQESSWVGMGWNVNAGAITRQINQYPDDAAGDIQSITQQNLTGVKGWYANIPLAGQVGWNNLQGFNGALSFFGLINVKFDSRHITNFNIIGINPHNGTIDVNQEQIVNGLTTIAGLGNPKGFGNAMAFNATLSIVGDLVSSSSSSDTGKGAPWAYNKRQEKKEAGGLYTNYWIWLDETRQEKMYGIMNLDAANANSIPATNLFEHPTALINNGAASVNQYQLDAVNKIGTASDVNYYIPPNIDFTNTNAASILALDNFQVKAAGVSGLIHPYRFEVGSVSVPRMMNSTHVRLSVLPYLNYKTPFLYDGAPSSGYLYHTGNTTPIYNYGLTATHQNDQTANIQLKLDDANAFGAQRIRPDLATQLKIPATNHIEWLSNSDIMNTAGAFTSTGFMDYFSATTIPSRYTVKSNSFNGTYAATPNGIGGFSITNANGLTYHFALPIYDYNYNLYIAKSTDGNQNTSINRANSFANTWLLTGITGADFVDRNSNGAIDETDWGYWVKFNYYQYNNLSWRIPETGDMRDDTSDETKATVSHLSGQREQYYLNSIETRSHVALFIKDEDYLRIGAERSLRLEEIALLKRETYNNLVANYSIPSYSGTVANRCFLWQFSNSYDINNPNAAGTYLVQNAIKRIKFTHTYELRSSNPQVANQGKRTLKRVSIYGRNGLQIIPDYKFDYGVADPANTASPAPNYTLNPPYNPDQWDGWGMYNSAGTSNFTNNNNVWYNSHTPSAIDADGSAWSLSRITTPMGSTIDVNYERDTYSSIGGFDALGPAWSFSQSASDQTWPSSFSASNLFTGTLSPGDFISMNGQVNYTCPGSGPPLNTPPQNMSFPVISNFTVQSISGNIVTLTSPYGHSGMCFNAYNIVYSGTVAKRDIKKGGGIRVGSLILNDQGRQYKTRYLYNLDDGRSSGVVAQEPPYTKTTQIDFNTIPGYPMTPVMYSKVSVLTGALNTDTDFHTKVVYEFETPNVNTLSLGGFYSGNSGLFQNQVGYQPLGPNGPNMLQVKNEISDYTSKIGSLKSIKVFDSSSPNPVSSTILNYTSQILNSGGVNNYQGLYSSGTLMHDVINDVNYKMTRSTTIKYPYTLQSIITQKDGFTQETDNIAWDFISGQVLEKNYISPSGLKTKSVDVPAYTKYPGMGPKAVNILNANMLGQNAATYMYKLNSSGTISGVLSGSVQTWANAWSNYRYLNPAGTAYLEDGSETGPNPLIWRPSKSYVYKGTYSDLQTADGSLKPAVPQFDFTNGAVNSGWQQVSEINRYDHFSVAVQTRDPLTGISSGTKRDINNKFVLATASNANYFEFSYSGAEDGNNSLPFFGGEVARGSGNVVTGIPGTDTHTGQSAVQLTTGNKSFIYKPYLLTPNRTYRAQVWTNSLSGGIYYIVNGGAEQTATPVAVNKAGNWYKILVDIPIPSIFSSCEVGVKSTSGTISFDDFRFQPRDGGLQANVYDAFGFLNYTLGNDNLYTRYYRDDRGIVMKTYIESIKYNGERLVSERKDNYKRNYTDK